MCEICMIIFHHKPRLVIPNEWKWCAEKTSPCENSRYVGGLRMLDDLVDTLPPANQHKAMEKCHQPKVSHESPENGTNRNRR